MQTIRKCVIYDPVFTEEDMNYFRDDGMEVLLSEVSSPSSLQIAPAR